ncbi:uncharacterized protein PAC_08217 [Phialocephala subalpina]|uniref:Ubiquitin-like domain-containing protein n=1 Tax=Phialocephala subalpina TaxID=576137 RepID=A0A1L7WZX4_9HELO|nr:uncharacterized protein PAC_08217 [Phialocephala subalpina]
MSFGFGITDVLTLVTLAYTTFDGAKRACGEHDELTQELSSLVTILDQVQSEISDPESPINTARGHRRKELKSHTQGCLRHVRQMNFILTTFNKLSSVQRAGASLWQKVRFGNGAVKDIAQIRLKISTYTTAITISLTLLSLGSRGEAERQLSRQRGELRGITESVNMLVAKLNATSNEGSIWTKCTDDELGFRHESLIHAYVRELDSRGVFNDEMRHSQSSVAAESDTGDPNMPELGADEVDLEVEAQNQNQVSELSAFDQAQGEDSSLPLDDSDYLEVEAWQEGEQLDQEHFSPDISAMAQRLESLEQLGRQQQQLLQTMSREEDKINEGIRVYKLLPSRTNGGQVKVNMMPSLHVDQHQAGDSDLSDAILSEPQSVTTETTSTADGTSNQDVDTPLDREAVAKERDEEFRALSSEEKKVIITMQDPSGRKVALPYFLVKTWDGMQYLIEQAFLNVESVGPRVAKGEYDLINLDGAVIIPHLWETFVEPDMLVTMQMWPPPSPQTPPALATKAVQFSPPPPVPWTPPRPPTPPRPSPSRSSMPQLTLSTRRLSNTSQKSSHRANGQKVSRKSVKWSLFGSSSLLPKAKSTKSKTPSSKEFFKRYLPLDYCTCYECCYPQTTHSLERPAAPSSLAAQFRARYSLGTPGAVESESFKKAASEDTEGISKVEPILELEGSRFMNWSKTI